MSAAVTITDVKVLKNVDGFLTPFSFEITFECFSELKDDLEFKVIYVGSAESEEHDQELDSVLVGPVPVGINKFVFQAGPPSVDKIPKDDVLGVTVVLLTCSYAEKEFIRVGYYVNNEYVDEELKENPPAVIQYDKVQRIILAEKPKVTTFSIDWENPELDPFQKAVEAIQITEEVGETDMEM